jgi:capsular polysaccharide biosynthesis protein
MKTSDHQQDEALRLYAETVSTRRLPINFDPDDLRLFNHELERVIPETRLLELDDVRISSDGILFKRHRLLPESFAFPFLLKQWKLQTRLKFLFINYLARRTRTIDGNALWITDDWSNGYFHWLADALSRLYVVRERLDDFVLLLPGYCQGRDFVESSLRAFGVKSVEFIKRDEVLSCRRVFLPTHTAPSGHYNEEIIRGVRGLLLKAYGAKGDSGAGDRIYISRSRAPKRKIRNEEAVCEVLAEFNFKTIHAEDLTFEQQVEICSRARYLVSNHGAGLTNMLFMPEDARVLELRHHTDCINNCYFTLSSALKLNYFYQTCLPATDGEDPHSADLIVELGKLRENVRLLTEGVAAPQVIGGC